MPNSYFRKNFSTKIFQPPRCGDGGYVSPVGLYVRDQPDENSVIADIPIVPETDDKTVTIISPVRGSEMVQKVDTVQKVNVQAAPNRPQPARTDAPPPFPRRETPNPLTDDAFPGTPLDLGQTPSKYPEPNGRNSGVTLADLFGPPPNAPTIGVIFEAHDAAGVSVDDFSGAAVSFNRSTENYSANPSPKPVNPGAKEVKGQASFTVETELLRNQKTLEKFFENSNLEKVYGQHLPKKDGANDETLHRFEPINLQDLNLDGEDQGEITGQLIVYDLDEELPSLQRASRVAPGLFFLFFFL